MRLFRASPSPHPKTITLLALGAAVLAAAPGQAAVAGWQLASTPERCLSFNTLGDGPPLQIGLLHQRGGPWVTLFGSNATAALAPGEKVTIRLEYEGGFARREFPAEARQIGQSTMLAITSSAASFSGFDPADISPPQALLLVTEMDRPFALNGTVDTPYVTGRVPAGFEAALAEFLACAKTIDASTPITPRTSGPTPRPTPRPVQGPVQGPPGGSFPTGR